MSPGNFALHVCAWMGGLPLAVLLMVAILRGAYKRYPFLLLYAAAYVVLTAIEIGPDSEAFRQGNMFLGGFAAKVYWIKVWVLKGLAFAVAINLIDAATSLLRRRRLARAAVITGALVIAGVTFRMRWGGPALVLTYWMSPWTADLSFAGGILDLALWAALIAVRRTDRRLLMLASALGIHFLGEGLGEAIRVLRTTRLDQSAFLVGTGMILLADLVFFYLSWRELRQTVAGQEIHRGGALKPAASPAQSSSSG